MNKSNAFRYTKIMLVHWCIDFVLKLLIGVQAVLSMAEHDRRLKFHHINTSLHLMVEKEYKNIIVCNVYRCNAMRYMMC
uniref:Uncharacterized protein n=1 Tax=Glycine max TaxID=3847 RepID=K7MWY5_SOYBN